MKFLKVIDYAALMDMHRTRSKESHYNNLPIDASNRDRFFSAKPIDLEYHIDNHTAKLKSGIFSFHSSIRSGVDRNDKVTGEVFLRKESKHKPNVIFVHGWRMDSYDRIKKIYHDKIVKNFDWNMYYYTLPYHFDREPQNSTYSGEHMISANISRTVHSSQQAIVELRGLIKWIKENEGGEIIVVGISLGGWLTNLLATVEKDMNIVVSAFYANNIAHSIWNTLPGKYIRRDLEEHGTTYEELNKAWDIMNPSKAKLLVDKENVLLISGKYDMYIDINDADTLWNSWNQPKRHVYSCGHAGIVLFRNRIAADTLQFIESRLKK
ncbi:alpha/beta hydrolase family protein [Bacillus pumilus]|uniref:alpha/beta hydrolase family protein n=1 Tax=Bacillus pumilus TaxID=1408 RepID=UPI0011E8BF70|nr:alpha/beta hydrolase family protein [Bacillus pumilus]TYS33016.1 abhydrolase domain-containing 18 [Bacillus pumilus]TYS50719.1 abhydrolase domain-containing 18 [Bacillus pumilus]